MNAATAPDLREEVDNLWTTLETHYRPGLIEADFKLLRSLDDAALDGTLTEARFKRVSKNLLTRPREYEVDHTTGEAIGYVHAGKHSPVHGEKHIDRLKSRKWRVRMNLFGEAISRVFDRKADAYRFRDFMIERREVEKQVRAIYRGDNGDRVAREVRALEAAKEASEARKAAIRQAQRDNPGMSWSDILRLPEFDLTGEPQKAHPRPRKSP